MAMIDGIKIKNLSINIEDLKRNSLLTFPLSNVSEQGEALNKPQIAQYRGMTFIVTSDNIKLSGSPHKYKNNGLHNYDDFYFSELKLVINDMYNKFGEGIANSLLCNVEFGVNVKTPSKPSDFINSLIHHGKKPFDKMLVTDKGNGRQCKHENYIIKVYDKSLQYKLIDNILRVEIRATRMQYFEDNNIPICRLSDLLNKDIYEPLGLILLNTFNQIVVFDHNIDKSNLNDKQKTIVYKLSNPLHWATKKKKQSDAERKAIYRELEEFKSIAESIGATGNKKEIANLIEAKSQELLKTENVPLSPIIFTAREPENCPTFTEIAKTEKTENCPTFTLKIKSENETLDKNEKSKCFCKVTGLDITNQKGKRIYISPTTIKWYYDHDPKIFNNNLLILLARSKYRNDSKEKQISEIYHNVRNRFLDPKHNTRRDRDNRGR